MKPERQLYLRVRGKITGPFGVAQLLSLRDRGQLRRFHEVSEDRQHWQSAASLAEVFPPEQAPAALEPNVNITSQPNLPVQGASTATAEWLYVDSQGQKHGPVPKEQLLTLRQASVISDATLVWREGLTDWVALSAAGLAPRTHRPGLKRLALAAAACLLVLAAGAVVATVSMLTGKSVTGAIPGISNSGPLITSPTDEKKLADAVGFVVCGAHVVLPDGSEGDGVFATGSCFAISTDGYLLTNKHVVEKSNNLKNARLLLKKMQDDLLMDVRPTVWVFFGKDKYVAEIRHVSEQYDLAVLKVERRGMPYFRLSSADKLPRGKKVITCGFPGASSTPLSPEEAVREMSRQSKQAKIETLFKPRDFEFVMTDGSVSRMLTEDGADRQWVQHNASISPGSSGGPLLDENGTVIGINTLLHKLAQGTFWSLATPQLKAEISKHAPSTVWE